MYNIPTTFMTFKKPPLTAHYVIVKKISYASYLGIYKLTT